MQALTNVVWPCRAEMVLHTSQQTPLILTSSRLSPVQMSRCRAPPQIVPSSKDKC